MVDPLALILSSPRFLYLVNPDIGEEKTTRALDAVSLANRLAAFLWSGPPDEELMRVAADGSLLDDAVLLEQTDRMLSHPRAKEFYEGFISQWMHLKRFDSVGLSSRFLLHYTDAYILSAKQEPVEFFKTLVEENLPSSNLIDSDFVTIDGVLAAKYGLTDHYTGDGFQKVILPAGSPRGGLTTQAAFLAIGTMGNRTSPVIRGSLVKEVLLNDPPPRRRRMSRSSSHPRMIRYQVFEAWSNFTRRNRCVRPVMPASISSDWDWRTSMHSVCGGTKSLSPMWSSSTS